MERIVKVNKRPIRIQQDPVKASTETAFSGALSSACFPTNSEQCGTPYVLEAPCCASLIIVQSILLAKYLGTHDFPDGFWKGKRVIELGSGCGLCGLAAGLLGIRSRCPHATHFPVGATVTITDQDFVVPQLEHNAKINKDIAPNVSVAALSWGSDTSFLHPPFDVVLMADLLYVDALSEKLCETVTALCDQSSLVIFCNERRDARLEERFLGMMRLRFAFEPVSLDRLHHKWRDPAIRVIQMRKLPR